MYIIPQFQEDDSRQNQCRIKLGFGLDLEQSERQSDEGTDIEQPHTDGAAALPKTYHTVCFSFFLFQFLCTGSGAKLASNWAGSGPNAGVVCPNMAAVSVKALCHSTWSGS